MRRLFWRRKDRRRTLIVPADTGGATGSVRVIGWLVLVASVVAGITWYCHRILDGAAVGEVVGTSVTPIYIAAAVFLLASFVVVILQSMRVAQRVAGPEYRLIQTLRRIRAGDVSFRIHLRRGDLLGGLAEECNSLLDWLNTNPPAGARTGTDVYEISALEPEYNEVQG